MNVSRGGGRGRAVTDFVNIPKKTRIFYYFPHSNRWPLRAHTWCLVECSLMDSVHLPQMQRLFAGLDWVTGVPVFSLHEILRKCCFLFNWNASLPLIQVKPTISSSLSNPGYFNSYEAQVLCKLEFICLIWMIMGSDLWAVVSIHSWNPAVRHLYREGIGQFSPFHAQTKRPAGF